MEKIVVALWVNTRQYSRPANFFCFNYKLSQNTFIYSHTSSAWGIIAVVFCSYRLYAVLTLASAREVDQRGVMLALEARLG
jgi:hypothetical protein